ncbi:MAG: serine hydrolase domain-containing protein [Methanosarcinaceae archaeon]
MNPRLVIALGISLSLTLSCTYQNKTVSETEISTSLEKYVTLDGMWKSTPETALHLKSITLQPVIHISGSFQNNLLVQGCFMWDGLFRDYWWLSEIEYDEAERKVILHDQDGSTFIGKINENKDTISGMVYSGKPEDLVPEERLDFIRARDIDIHKLFIPKVPEKDGSIMYSYQKPEVVDGGIKTGSVYQYIKDSTMLSRFLEEVIRQEYGRLESLLILKDQELVLEEYYYGYDRDETHNIHSCTKSIVSLLVGLAINENGLPDVNQPIGSFFPKMDLSITEDKNKITLHHVLTMTAGFQSDESYFGLEQEKLAKYILNLPLESGAGEQFRYNSECPYLLGSIIYAKTGLQVDDYAKEKLFDPLGISNYQWEGDNGAPHCHSHLHMTPRDMAKIGLLVLNDGQWNNQQIIPKEWVGESTKSHVRESDFFNYGYQWWHRSNLNKSWWKEDFSCNEFEHEMVLALGWGGQYIFIIKDLDLVIVVTSSDYNEGNGVAHKKVPMVIEEIIPLFE